MDWELPDMLTFDFLNELAWKPGPLDNYEVCELGFVRRPSSLPVHKGVMQPGFLYAPEMRGPVAVRYRLHNLGSKRPVYLPPEEVMKAVFKKFRNKSLNTPGYVLKVRELIVAFNEQHFIQDKRRVYAEKYEPGMIPMRCCATCGKQTRSYRCDACWAKIKATSTACDEPTSEYSFGRR